jgi:hypothetical protein
MLAQEKKMDSPGWELLGEMCRGTTDVTPEKLTADHERFLFPRDLYYLHQMDFTQLYLYCFLFSILSLFPPQHGGKSLQLQLRYSLALDKEQKDLVTSPL